MSLVKAVLQIEELLKEDAQRLYNKGGNTSDESFALVLKAYAAQLRVAVTAAEGNEATRRDFGGFLDNPRALPLPAEARRLVEKEEPAGGFGASMAELVDGNSGGDMLTIDPAMPVNAKTLVGGQVYQLRADGKLHFLEEETAKLAPKQQPAELTKIELG